jgi:hypothetical protein
VIMIRRVGACILAVAAIVVWFAMGPSNEGDRSSDVSQALLTYDLNEARTEGAPQQTVVNGWVAKDLLAIIAEDERDDRPAALLGLLVLGAALALITSPSSPKVTKVAGAHDEPTSESSESTPAPKLEAVGPQTTHGPGTTWPPPPPRQDVR